MGAYKIRLLGSILSSLDIQVSYNSEFNIVIDSTTKAQTKTHSTIVDDV